MARSRIVWAAIAAVLIATWAAVASIALAPRRTPLAVANLAPAAEGEAEYVMKVTPTEFFSGELKRLKEHVDFKAACFKIVTSGHVECRPSVEMWCDGERVDHPSYGFVEDPHAGEVTMSWRRRVVKGKVEYYVVVGGIKTFDRTIEQPKSKQHIVYAFGPVLIKKPVTLKKKDGSVVVWAMGAGGAGEPADLANPKEVNRMLKTAPWVLILRLEAHTETGDSSHRRGAFVPQGEARPPGSSRAG